jgi:hypothetical protein
VDEIQRHNGAVFFVDILGISALTNELLPLEKSDYKYWLKDYQVENTPQYLAAAILSKFRSLLMALDDEFENVTISQLSDCAFAWSEEITQVVLFASKFMNRAIKAGLLCRGGLAYGEIIETNHIHSLGRLIVGKAVTKAAKLEGLSKGARVLISEDLSLELYHQNKKFSELTIPIFQPFTNPLDYRVYDEFKWYLFPELLANPPDLSILSFNDRVKNTKERLKIGSEVRCSSKFNWNTKSEEGLVHLRATINFITASSLLKVSHKFHWNDSVPKRDQRTVQELNNFIDTDTGYRDKSRKA